MEKILVFMVFLCPLIFFHELGHFLFARLFGVRVETFSLGFGPKLFKKKWRSTEYAFSLIPLGGYVKMFGDDPYGKSVIPEHEKAFAFNHKGKWARFWIVFGGPLANFILTLCLYTGLALFGEKVPAPKFGFVPSDSVFYKLGLRTGDTVTKINDSDIFSFLDFPVQGEADQVKGLTITRNGKKIHFGINLPFKQFSEDFAKQERTYRRPIFISKDGKSFVLSPSATTIDWDHSLDEIIVSEQAHFYLIPFKTRVEDVEKSEMLISDALEVPMPTNLNPDMLDQAVMEQLYQLGYYSEDLKVKSIATGTAADKAGLKKDDVIIALDGKPLFGFNYLRSQIQNTEVGKSRNIKYWRTGNVNSADVIPETSKNGDEEVKVIGVYSAVEFLTPQLIQSPPKSLFESISMGFKRTGDAVVKTITSFQKLIIGESSLKNLGGPIAIGKVATESLDISISYFFGLMALISVNLGVINLFPIPVLDGGHILFIFFETLNRGPLSRRKMEVAQQFGLSLLVLLIFAAVINDLYRVIF